MLCADRTQPVLEPSQRIEILSLLRGARAALVEDAEGFQRAVLMLERIGQLLPDGETPKPSGKFGLAKFQEHLLALALKSPLSNGSELRRLYDLIRAARNDAVHEGAFARHMASRLMEFLLILEDALMIPISTVKDRMVHSPMIAEPWHLVANVRNTMLANAFSYLPYYLAEGNSPGWVLISDHDLVTLVPPWLDWKEKHERLNMRMQAAVSLGKLNYSRLVV